MASSSSSADYSLDLEELRRFQSIAKRPRKPHGKMFLALSKAEAPVPIARTPTPGASNGKATSYVTLGSFCWDQDTDKLKLYVSLEGVDQEKVGAEFKPMSVDVKFHDNYRCAVPKLHQEIVPEKSKITVKPNKVIITLQKDSKGNGLDLHFKEDKLKPKSEENPDPMAGIMDLMKNMYEEGDDEMKRTIAKAWTDARSGKTSDSLSGFR
ncbi:Calcyclin-binding protein [Nymphaea thermarum]|nr:Calcyclin-binding protein [Nymphaea thermarum]